MSAKKRTFAYLFGVLLLAEVTMSSRAENLLARPKPHGILENDFQAPISFEPNQGQTEDRVKFMARGSGYNLFLTPSNALFFLRQPGTRNDLVPADSDVFTMNVVGANPVPKITGREELPSKSSYFLGGDPKKWRTNIPNFGRVEYADIYPGIDLVYHGTQGQLEYDFVLHPGTSPKTIAMEFTGVKDIRISPRGELVLETARGQVCFHKPVAYQENRGNRRAVQARYRWIHNHRVGFTVGAYDLSKTLIIDPVSVARQFTETDRRTHGRRETSVLAARTAGFNPGDSRGLTGKTSQLGSPVIQRWVRAPRKGLAVMKQCHQTFVDAANLCKGVSDDWTASGRDFDCRSILHDFGGRSRSGFARHCSTSELGRAHLLPDSD
jgi:hypothetical protein